MLLDNSYQIQEFSFLFANFIVFLCHWCWLKIVFYTFSTPLMLYRRVLLYIYALLTGKPMFIIYYFWKIGAKLPRYWIYKNMLKRLPLTSVQRANQRPFSSQFFIFPNYEKKTLKRLALHNFLLFKSVPFYLNRITYSPKFPRSCIYNQYKNSIFNHARCDRKI